MRVLGYLNLMQTEMALHLGEAPQKTREKGVHTKEKKGRFVSKGHY